jgi:hypothetical protein
LHPPDLNKRPAFSLAVALGASLVAAAFALSSKRSEQPVRLRSMSVVLGDRLATDAGAPDAAAVVEETQVVNTALGVTLAAATFRHSGAGRRHVAAVSFPEKSRSHCAVCAVRTRHAVARLGPAYIPRRPHATVLHRLVREHYESFVAHTQATYAAPLPRYVIDAFERYLVCGDFSQGFIVCHGDVCRHDVLLSFSCKQRGLCPSCGCRRMCDEAATITDRILPSVRRLLVASTSTAPSALRRTMTRAVSASSGTAPARRLRSSASSC